MISKGIAIALLLIGMVVIGYLVREMVLLRNGQMLLKSGATLPRDYSIGDPQDKPITYLVLGDSISVGTGASTLEATMPYRIAQALSDHHRYVHVINQAQNGATVTDVLNSQIPLIRNIRFDYLTMTVGANDATHLTDFANFKRDYGEVLRQLQLHQPATILLATTPDLSFAPAFPWPVTAYLASRADQQNQLLKSLTSGQAVTVVDLFGHGKLDYNLNHSLYAADKFHPADAGYTVWAALFNAAL